MMCNEIITEKGTVIVISTEKIELPAKFDIKLGKKIEGLRNSHAETQATLAQVCDKPNRVMVARWEDGSSYVKAHDLYRIVEHYNVSADYLLGRSDVASTDRDIQNVAATLGISEKAIENLMAFKGRDFCGIDVLNMIFGSDFFRRAVNYLSVATGVDCDLAENDNAVDTATMFNAAYGIGEYLRAAQGNRKVKVYPISGRSYLDFLKQQAQNELLLMCNEITEKIVELNREKAGEDNAES